jgi:hypothetical protein
MRCMPDPTDATDPFPTKWADADLAFAGKELHLEFPMASELRVKTAVDSAAPFVPVLQGRVQLLRKAREFMRT